MNNDFKFFINADVIKGDGTPIGKEDELDYDNMFVAGIASTMDKDMQGEILNPKNFELDYFLEAGKINYNHTIDILGEPIDAKITSKGELYVKGRLYNSSKLAKDIYKNTFIMQSDPNSTRRMSWSIEGQATERDEKNPNKILKVRISGIALTYTPINFKNTYAEVVKAFTGNDSEIFKQVVMSELEKSIRNNAFIDEDLKEDLIDWNITPETYCMFLSKIWNSNEFKDVKLEKAHRLIDIMSIYPESDISTIKSVYEKLNQ